MNQFTFAPELVLLRSEGESSRGYWKPDGLNNWRAGDRWRKGNERQLYRLPLVCTGGLVLLSKWRRAKCKLRANYSNFKFCLIKIHNYFVLFFFQEKQEACYNRATVEHSWFCIKFNFLRGMQDLFETMWFLSAPVIVFAPNLLFRPCSWVSLEAKNITQGLRSSSLAWFLTCSG